MIIEKTRPEKKKLNIIVDIQAIDWFCFNQLYKPIIKVDIADLYCNIYYQKTLFNHLNIDSYDLKTFLKDLNLTYSSFKKGLSILERFNLCKFYVEEMEDEFSMYWIQLNSPSSMKEFLNDDEMKELFMLAVSENKYTEISYLLEHKKDNPNKRFKEIELSMPIDSKNKESITEINLKNLEKFKLNKDLYYEFYNYVFSGLNDLFEISPSVLKIINNYVVKNKTLKLKDLNEFAVKSLRKTNIKGWFIDDKVLLSLIEYYSFKKDKFEKEFQLKEYKSFWINIFFTKDEVLLNYYKNLFNDIPTWEFYLKISNSNIIPAKINSWIKFCTEKQGFSFGVLNGILSFVKFNLKKVPANYLIKITNNLYQNECVSYYGFIEHFKNVLGVANQKTFSQEENLFFENKKNK